MKINEMPDGTLEMYGDSSEGKPMTYTRWTGETIDIPNASKLYFIDNSEFWMFNSVKNAWNKQ